MMEDDLPLGRRLREDLHGELGRPAGLHGGLQAAQEGLVLVGAGGVQEVRGSGTAYLMFLRLLTVRPR